MSKPVHIGIIGGGLLGLSIAHELLKSDHQVTVCESSGKLGGLATPADYGTFSWDKYYHVILLSDNHTRTLIDEIGLSHTLKWVETKTGFYTNGQLISMSNTPEFLKFPPLNLVDKFRLGMTIFYASRIKNWKKLEKVLVADWLRNLSGKNTFDKIWMPLLRAKLGDLYEHTAASFIWATIQRMYAARKSGLKKEMFGYARGGYSSILKGLEQQIVERGGAIKKEHRFVELDRGENGSLVAGFEKQDPLEFDKLILTIPSPTFANLKIHLSDNELKKHLQVPYLGVVCLAMVLNRPVSPFYVTNITDGHVPFTGVIEMTSLVDPGDVNNSHLIYLPRYLASNDDYFEKYDSEITDEFVTAFLKMYPDVSKSNIKHTVVARDRHVCAVPGINYSANLPALKPGNDNLFILNSSQIVNATLNVNETLRLAKKSVELVHEGTYG